MPEIVDQIANELVSIRHELVAKGANIHRGLPLADWPDEIERMGTQQGGRINYSFDEQDTGSLWVTGQKVYQKTIDLNGRMPAAGQSTSTPHGIAALDMIVGGSVVAKDPSQDIWFIMPYLDGTSIGYNVGVWFWGQQINLTAGTDRTSFTIAYATLQYTCNDR